MKVLVIFWLLGSYEVTGQSSGTQLKFGQHALNKAVSYSLNHELVPFLQHHSSLGDYGFKFGPTQFNVTKLQFHEVTGLTSNVHVLDGDKIGMNIGIDKLALRGNITHVAGEDTNIAPNTDLNFLFCRLEMLFKCGHVKDRNGLTLETCEVSFGDFKASGDFRNVLEGLYQLFAQKTISSITEKVCTSLKRLTKYRLNDDLSAEDSFPISSSTLGDLSMRTIPRSFSTERGFFVVTLEVTTGKESPLDDFTFPQHAFQQTANDEIMCINDELLSKISQMTIQNITLNELKFEKTINEITYNIQANQKSVQGTVRSTEDGTCIIWNATLHVQSKGDKCIQLKIKMDGMIPFAFNYSYTTMLASVDRDRLQMKYEVSSYERTCKRSEPSTDMQKNLLQAIDNELEALLAGKTFSLIFPRRRWYEFKDAKLKPTNGGLSVSFGIKVENKENSERFKSLYHKIYDRKRISFTLSDDQTIEADVPVTTVTTTRISATQQISHTTFGSKKMKGDTGAATLPISASPSLFLSKCTYLVICAAVTVRWY